MNVLELLLWPLTVAIAVIFNVLTSHSAAPVIDDVAPTPSPAMQRAARQRRYRNIMDQTIPGSFDRMQARNAELKAIAEYERTASAPPIPWETAPGRRVRQVYRPPGAATPDLDFFGRAEATPL